MRAYRGAVVSRDERNAYSTSSVDYWPVLG